jgi:phosphoserine phosphatase RsbU/P
MYGSDPQITAGQVLRALRHDELHLFLGAAFTTVGLISAAFAFLGRKFDSMLFWLALFAIFYGQRLWLESGFLYLLVPRSLLYDRLIIACNYIVPVPAFFYVDAAGYLGRFSRKIAIGLSIPFTCLFLATMLFGPRQLYLYANNLIIILSLTALVIQSFRRNQSDRDFVVVRWGLAAFVVLAIHDNIAVAFRSTSRIEPLGFAVFLATLGYVAVKRSLARDIQFGEIQKELEIARRIQTAILPGPYPDSPHFHVAARYVPMTSVAGDFYDFVVADQQHAGLLIADVSGHGVPAALIASMVKLAATSQRANATEPALLLSGLNSALCGNTQQQFVTAAYVYLDAVSATLRYSAAAHPPMLLLRAGKVVEVEENGLMLAVFSFATYSTVVHPLELGDRLLLYTDGILEAANAQGEEFGPQRLHTIVQESARLNAEEAADQIISSLNTWSKLQNDDLTLLVCDYANSHK